MAKEKKSLFTPTEWDLMQDYMANAGRMPRMNLIRLIDHVDPNVAKLGMNSGPYIALDRLLNNEQIDFACHLKLRQAAYITDLAAEAGIPVEEAARIADELARIGLVEYKPDADGVDRIEMGIFIVGIMEQLILDESKDRLKENPEIGVGFHKHCEYMMSQAHFLPAANHGVHRVVPIETAIANESKHASWEELTTLIEESAHGSYCITECICRKMSVEYGEAADEPDTHWCMPLGDYAEYAIRSGKGRRVTKEEYMARLREAEERGFVHNISNHDGPSPIKYVCNCDYQTCMSIRASILTNVAAVNASNFVAKVDADKCVACGQCVEKCPMNAVTLGQKLPQVHPVPYEDLTSPSAGNALSWPDEKWNHGWQTNRKNIRPETGTSPCKTDCPAHVSVQGYLRLAALGRYDEALALIKKNNPLPAVCGSICNRRCEQVCTRGDVDHAVAIDEVKKFLAMRELHAPNRYVPKKLYSEGKKIAVIGSGPAGLSCAYYLAERGHSVTVFEKQKEPGGMLRYGLPSFRLEKDIVAAEIDVLKQMGVTFRCDTEIGTDLTIPDLKAEGYLAFYAAPGLQGSNRPGIPGEEASGVMPGLEFMKLVNGESDFMLNGKVVVIGGGNIASDIARTAVRCGGQDVTMFALESMEELPCGPEDIAEFTRDGVAIETGWGPMQIHVEDGKCTGITFKKCINVKDENGRFAPKYEEAVTKTVDADYVLYCIGQRTSWEHLLDGTKVRLNGRSLAQADPFTYQTDDPDVFVGGDAFTGQKFCIDAIAAGKQAAISIHRYVWGHNLVTGRDRNEYRMIDKNNLELSSYDTAKRQTPAVDLSKRLSRMDERGVFTEEQVRLETVRCLKCGAAHVDQNLCLGCGVCTTRCKFDAISLERVHDDVPVANEELMSDIRKELLQRRDNLFEGKKSLKAKILKPVITKVILNGTAKPKSFHGKVKPRDWQNPSTDN